MAMLCIHPPPSPRPAVRGGPGELCLPGLCGLSVCFHVIAYLIGLLQGLSELIFEKFLCC